MNLHAKIRDKKAVFLDLDNTLYSYAPCHAEALKSAFRTYRKYVAILSWKTFCSRYGHARKIIHERLAGQAASHSRLLYFQTLLELSSSRTDPRNTLRLEKSYWDAFLKRMRLKPWVLPFLRFCRKNRKAVLVVTNLTTDIQLRKLRELRLEKFVDYLVSSEEAGIEKPGIGIFRLALKKSGCRPGEVLMIDDESPARTFPALETLKM